MSDEFLSNRKEESPLAAYGLLILTFSIWGSLYVVSKYVLGKLPVFTISFFRFAIAFAVLTCLMRGRKERIERKDWPYILAIGIGGYFVAVGAQLLGTRLAGASLASLLNSLNPITMTLFGAVFLHEKLTVRKILGILLAVAGVYVILGGHGGSTAGILLSLFAVLFWSGISVLTRKVTQKYNSMTITKVSVGIAALCYLPVCITENATGASIHFDVSCVLALIYMGAICTGAAYAFWNRSLSRLEAGTCSVFYPVQTLVSSILGILLLNEKSRLSFWIGTALIISGILTTLIKRRRYDSKT